MIDQFKEAARYVDAGVEEHGLEGWLRLRNVDPDALRYVVGQRALRAAMLHDGIDPTKLSRTEPTSIELSAEAAAMMPLLRAVALDGIATGLTVTQLQENR